MGQRISTRHGWRVTAAPRMLIKALRKRKQTIMRKKQRYGGLSPRHVRLIRDYLRVYSGPKG